MGVGLILAGAAWFAGWFGWAESQEWMRLDQPVTVAHRHLQSREFDITIASTYWFTIDRDVACPAPLPVSWLLHRGGRVVASGQSVGAYFTAAPGRYSLSVDFGQDGCRAGSSPRLFVVEGGDAQAAAAGKVQSARYAFLVLLVVGGYLFVRALLQMRRAYPSLTEPGPQWPTLATIDGPAERFRVSHPSIAGKLWHRWPLGTQPVVLVVYVLIIFVFMFSSFPSVTPKGLPVHLQPGRESVAGVQPLYVFVRGIRNVTVDGRPVAWKDLAPRLREKLRLRNPDWPVYVDGDGELEWQRVAEVIDAVRGTQAKVVLLARSPGR